jgi:hypothetical protein
MFGGEDMAPWEYEECHSADAAVGGRIVDAKDSRPRWLTLLLIDNQSSIIMAAAGQRIGVLISTAHFHAAAA